MIKNFIRKQCPECGRFYNAPITNMGDWKYTCNECGIIVEGCIDTYKDSPHIFQKLV